MLYLIKKVDNPLRNIKMRRLAFYEGYLMVDNVSYHLQLNEWIQTKN